MGSENMGDLTKPLPAAYERHRKPLSRRGHLTLTVVCMTVLMCLSENRSL